MRAGRMVSCRFLQAGHMKSLYNSSMIGADGLPIVLALSTSAAAATHGSSAAKRSAKILICIIVIRDGPVGVLIPDQHRPRSYCDRLLGQHAIHVAFEQRITGPLA